MDDYPRPPTPTKAETAAETLVRILNQVGSELAEARKQRAVLEEIVRDNQRMLREILGQRKE